MPGDPSRVAVLLATAPAIGRGAAALLPTPEGPVALRTLRQLQGFGVRRVVVLTRPEWAADVRDALASVDGAAVVEVSSPAAAVRAVADEAEAAAGHSLLLVDGDVVVHEAVLEGLLEDPRVQTGAVFARGAEDALLKVRVERGRVTAVETAYHRCGGASAAALGLVHVAGAHVGAVQSSAAELAGLLAELPPGWEDELSAKLERWTAQGRGDLEHARDVAVWDVGSLVLLGLVRGGAPVAGVALGGFPCVRVYSPDAADAAAALSGGLDADRLRLAAAVKSRDGFVTTHLVSPYSRHIARWAARRGLRPNQVTVFSMVLGVVAALLFAVGTRPGLVAGAVVLWAAFVADCVDGQLARYTRQFSKLGAWLDALFDRAKEYVVFAGLAVGGVRAGDDGTIWLLAAAALALQVTRHAIAFSYGLSQRPPPRESVVLPLTDPGDGEPPAESVVEADTQLLGDDQPRSRTPLAVVGRAGVSASRFFEQRSSLKWAKRVFVLPIGERFLVMAIVAAVWTPRTVFVVLLVWGGLALAYTATGRLLRSVA